MSAGGPRKETEREAAWCFLKPEAGDREVPTCLMQRRLREGEEGDHTKSVG